MSGPVQAPRRIPLAKLVLETRATGPLNAAIHPDGWQRQAGPLAVLLAYAEREAARRAKGTHPGMVWLQDEELAALLDLLRREVGTVAAEGARER